MREEIEALTINIAEYTGDEEAFVPEGIIIPQFELKPQDAFNAQNAFKYLPGAPKPIDRTVVINIETTGVKPYDSRITAICCKDAADPNSNLVVWISENEAEMLEDFLAWFEASGYNTLVGYNVAFDLRFLFVKAMGYGYQAPAMFNVNLDDVAETMKQVRHEYTFGFNRPYKLADWAAFFFNEQQDLTVEELLTAWGKQDYAAVVDYVERQVDWTYRIWAMAKWVFDELQELPSGKPEMFLEVVPEQAAEGVSFTLQPKSDLNDIQSLNSRATQCTVCLSEVVIPEGLNTVICPICGEVVTR